MVFVPFHRTHNSAGVRPALWPCPLLKPLALRAPRAGASRPLAGSEGYGQMSPYDPPSSIYKAGYNLTLQWCKGISANDASLSYEKRLWGCRAIENLQIARAVALKAAVTFRQRRDLKSSDVTKLAECWEGCVSVSSRHSLTPVHHFYARISWGAGAAMHSAHSLM